MKSYLQTEPLTPPGIESERSMAVAPHPLWANPRVLAGICLLLITYGSLLPFDLRWPASWGGVFAGLAWVEPTGPTSRLGLSASASDLLINLLLYVPLGVLMRFSLPARLRNRAVGVLCAISAVFATSLVLESLQTLTSSRVGAFNDVLANGISGGAAACVAPWVWAWFRSVVFRMYCRSAGLRYRIALWFERSRERPAITFVLVGINAVLIAAWYLAQVGAYVQEKGGGSGLPFEDAFALPYDEAAFVLGRALLTYVALSTLILLALMTGWRRVRLGWIVVAVVAVAVAAQAHQASVGQTSADLTQPILAAVAATLLTLTMYCFGLAVRKANRRRADEPYEGPERRRIS